jgi:hypothetical protein
MKQRLEKPMSQSQRIKDQLVFLDSQIAELENSTATYRALMDNKSDPAMSHKVAKDLAELHKMKQQRDEVAAMEPKES